MDKIEHDLLLVIRGALPINEAKIPGLRAPPSLDPLVPGLLWATELLCPWAIGSVWFPLLGGGIADESMLTAEDISNGLCGKVETFMPACCRGTGGGGLVGGGG